MLMSFFSISFDNVCVHGYFFSSSRLTVKLSCFMAWGRQCNPAELTKEFPFLPSSLLPSLPSFLLLSFLPSFLSSIFFPLPYNGSRILYVFSYICLNRLWNFVFLQQAYPRIFSSSTKRQKVLECQRIFQIQYTFSHSI